MTAIGIDFGTTNSVVAHWSPNGVEVLDIDTPPAKWGNNLGFERIMPSVFAKDHDDRVLFGWAAKQSPSRFEAVKRMFATKRETITNDASDALEVDYLATMLFTQLRAAAALRGYDANQAVVTVPANSRGRARHLTKVCAGMGGLQVLALINEPTAAAMAYAVRKPGDRQLLVFDWGGGTLDVTILRSVDGVFMEQASKGLPTLGGIDFDTRVRKLLLRDVPDTSGWSALERRQFDLDVELAKIRLSTQEFTEVQLPDGRSRRVTREEFEKACESLIEEARRPIQQCLADISAGTGSINSLLMVGGTSKIPAVRRFVSELLNMSPEVDIDPMTAIGEGAAIAAAILTGELETNDFFVGTEHALGTVALDRTGHLTFSALIPRNHMLPAKQTETYSPATPNQKSAVISVIEGDPEAPLDHPDNVILKEWPIDFDSSSPDRSIDITYEYDVNGILHVTVTSAATGNVILQEQFTYVDMGPEDKRKLAEKAKAAHHAVKTGRVPEERAAKPTDPEVAKLLQQAEAVKQYLEDDDADVQDAVNALEKARPEDLEERKRGLRDALAPYSFLF